MGLQCSILGHSFEPAGVEREREEQGSEVVTTEREIERCNRCGTERVVSESTEVTAVVDGDAVGIETTDTDVDTDIGPADAPDEPSGGGGFAGVVDRSDLSDDEPSATSEPDADSKSDRRAADETEIIDTEPASATAPDRGGAPSSTPDTDVPEEPPDPETEDAEILTDEDEPSRKPGQWPEEADSEDSDTRDESDIHIETEPPTEPTADESLSGITVPEGEIVCPECGFSIEAQSGYRDGDSCPECNAWLEAERNQ